MEILQKKLKCILGSKGKLIMDKTRPKYSLTKNFNIQISLREDIVIPQREEGHVIIYTDGSQDDQKTQRVEL